MSAKSLKRGEKTPNNNNNNNNKPRHKHEVKRDEVLAATVRGRCDNHSDADRLREHKVK